MADGSLVVDMLTPEQAIAATLGSGTCELVETDSYSNANEVVHVLECSACGKSCEHVNGSYPKCPHCGREVRVMIDYQTIEQLRKLLDERGVEYETDEWNAIIKWSTYHGAFVFFARQREGKLLVETTVATEHSVILTPEQAVAATLGNEREAKLIRAMEDVLRHATDTVWVGEAETLVDRMVSLGVYKHDVYEGARPWEVD